MRYADGKYREKLYSVYMHISPSNKCYIGITSQPLDIRWNEGKGYKYQKYFYRAIQKYGWDNFQHICLFTGLSFDDASFIEKDLISKFNSNNPKYGYNLTNGGEGISGYHLTKEQLKRHSEVSKGRKHTQATKDKISRLNTGRKLNLTDEQREACAERARLMGKHNVGRKHSKETIEKIRQSRLNYFENGGKPSHCKPHSEETKRKISEARKRIVEEQRRKSLCDSVIQM